MILFENSMDFIQYWYLFPLGVVIASLYTSTGISGSNFWIPVYLFIIHLDPLISFWLALVSMIFGSLGGLIGHTRNKTIDWFFVKKYLPVTIPFAISGALLVNYVNVDTILIVFGLFVFSFGIFQLIRSLQGGLGENQKVNNIRYLNAIAGGFLTGIISVGLGKLILPSLISQRRISHHAMAAGTTLVIVFITSLIVVFFRLTPTFISSLKSECETILFMLMFEIPGVLVGAQIGPYIVQRISLSQMRIYVAFLLITIGTLVIVRAFS